MSVLDFLARGLIGDSWLVVGGLLLLFTQLTIISVTLYLHRCQAHRACDMHPVLGHLFRFWLWLTTGMSTKEWVAIHRKHHARCETEEDPHSPQFHGIRKVLLEGAELYVTESGNAETLERFGRGTPDDWIEHHVYTRMSGTLGPTLMMLIDLVLFGAVGVTFWAVQMMWIPFFAAGVINGLGHWWGYRNFETPDTAHNLTPWAFFLGGEELHNNHHAFPSSAKFALKSWEFDLGWQVLRGLSKLGLVKILRVAPSEPALHDVRKDVDKDTIRALLTHRFQLLSHYWREVIVPVLRDEAQHAGESWTSLKRECKRLLHRDGRFVKGVKRERREALLRSLPRLATVFEYRRRLMAIWSRSTGNTQALVESLTQWCRDAEASGIHALECYASRLRRMTPATG